MSTRIVIATIHFIQAALVDLENIPAKVDNDLHLFSAERIDRYKELQRLGVPCTRTKCSVEFAHKSSTVLLWTENDGQRAAF